MKQIKTKRLILRPLKDSDAQKLSKIGNNKKIWLNLTDNFPHPYTLKDAQKWIKINKEKESTENFAITINKELIGMIGYEKIKEHVVSIGYWIGEPYWGKGYVTEALKEFLEHLFKNPNIIRIEAKVFSYNLASCRVLEKQGFTKEGLLRKREKKANKYVDEWIYALIKEQKKTKH
ncbi:GNAT family N-acetyltransferase [Candidatus Woesearchaeota archaeon]|nr:GNAT family N-acetyltransferase [Candidatus Woesearchaeota archaeon]